MPLLVFSLRECAERKERADIKLVVCTHCHSALADLDLFLVLHDEFEGDFAEDAGRCPEFEAPTALLEHLTAHFIFADKLSRALLLRYLLVFILLNAINELSRQLPIIDADRFIVTLEVVNLEELESAAHVLQEVTYEQV